jgi:hypothetical protein
MNVPFGEYLTKYIIKKYSLRLSNNVEVQTDTAQPLVTNCSSSEDEIIIKKLKRYKLPGSYQSPAELIHAGGEILCSEIHKFINFTWNKKICLITGRSLLLYQFTRRVIKLTVVMIMGYHCHQLHTKFYPTSVCQGKVHIQIRPFEFVRYWRKNGSTMKQYISYS